MKDFAKKNPPALKIINKIKDSGGKFVEKKISGFQEAITTIQNQEYLIKFMGNITSQTQEITSNT
jgi:hypothetical protein